MIMLVRPAVTRMPYAAPPLANAAINLLSVLVDSASRISKGIFCGATASAAASDKMEVAAACTSNIPVIAAVASVATCPKREFKVPIMVVAPDRIAAKTNACQTLKAAEFRHS